MTIVDIYKPNKSYRSVNLHKFNSITITKPINVYLYLQVIKDENKNFICIKYMVLQGQLNYVPINPIEFNNETNILNKASIKINNYVKLNVFLVDKLTNPNFMKYRCNFTYLKLNNNYIKSFFNINSLSYKNANITHKLQNFNTAKLEDELLCNLLDNIKI
jgi:hypothetical protein